MKFLMGALCLLAVASGCAANPGAFYSIHQVDLGPDKVYTRPSNLEISKSSVFEDEFVKVTFKSSNPGIGMDIANKSDGSIYVNWDNAAYIDNGGTSHRVIHTGIKYIEKEESQAETVIPRGATIDDVILSVDSIYYVPDVGWADTMFTTKMWGQRLKVLLPIKCADGIREYLFDLELMNEDIVLGKTDVKTSTQ